MQKTLSLYELNTKIKYGLEGLFPFPVWIVAEISEIKARQHCYLELVEREEQTDKIVAKSRATIWARSYGLIKSYFETTTGYELSAGLKILVQVEVQFSEQYGLSLNIKNIDPNYTLGDLQQRKQQIIQQLKEEGIFDMNKALYFASVPKNIAIISSEKSAGYQDFIGQLQQNPFGYTFHTKLFPALMQGEQAEQSIIQALEKIYEYEDIFDAVVIIRGGGAVSDLSCFDSYELGANIAQFPLPILTGIGHDKDKSVVDEVAYRALKTPTAVADYFIQCFQIYEDKIIENYDKFSNLVQFQITEQKRNLEHYSTVLQYSTPQILKENQQKLEGIAKNLIYLVKEQITIEKNKSKIQEQDLQGLIVQYQEKQNRRLEYAKKRLHQTTIYFLEKQKKLLEHNDRIAELVSPQKTLERGYSITTSKGKIIKDAKQLPKGTEVETQLAKGKFTAIIK